MIVRRHLCGTFPKQNLGSKRHVFRVRDELKLDRRTIARSQDALRMIHRCYPNRLTYGLRK